MLLREREAAEVVGVSVSAMRYARNTPKGRATAKSGLYPKPLMGEDGWSVFYNKVDCLMAREKRLKDMRGSVLKTWHGDGTVTKDNQ